jgi:hypothetical protein
MGTFIDLRPKYVKKGQVREGLCGHCRDGVKKEQLLKHLHTELASINKSIAMYAVVQLATYQPIHSPDEQQLIDEFLQKHQPTVHLDIYLMEKLTKLQMRKDELDLQVTPLEPQVEAYLRHLEIAEHQKQAYKECLESLTMDTAVIVMDFAAAYQIPYKSEESSDEWFSKEFVHDLVVTLVKLNEEGERTHYYYDFFCEKENHDTLFTRQALDQLLSTCLQLIGITKIYLWSDGGPHHFKIYRTLGLVANLIQPYFVDIEYNFFASCHGKSYCDAHIGVSKQKIRAHVKSTGDVNTVADVIDVLNTLKNTSAMDLKTIDRSDPHNVQKFKTGVKKYHQFIYSIENDTITVDCHIMSGDDEAVSESLVFVGDWENDDDDTDNPPAGEQDAQPAVHAQNDIPQNSQDGTPACVIFCQCSGMCDSLRCSDFSRQQTGLHSTLQSLK